MMISSKWLQIVVSRIRTRMVTDPLDVPLRFRFHLCNKVGRRRVVAARKEEVLPDEDPFSVTDLVEIIRFDDAATPDTYLLSSVSYNHKLYFLEREKIP
jgi:hypothetical protein